MPNTLNKTIATVNQTDNQAHNFEIDPASLSSVTLTRLAQEVKNSDPAMYGSFDRVHNKHNR